MTGSDPQSHLLSSAAKERPKCGRCGATIRLDTGVCVGCLLREGLHEGGKISQASYQNVLAEVDAPQKSWFLGNYEILEQIGCGGMGVIYRARQRHSRRIVAVKRVLSYRADSHEALQRFRREAQAVASLDHPNILPIYEVSESGDGLPFFSMKFAEKGSLHENLASFRDQPRKCVQLMVKVAHAVEYAHSRGVLHRDIKPGNILLNERGEPLVSDFGLAKLLDGNNDLTRSLTTFGTAGFIAPEQAGHAAVDFTPVADVYSLGAVLFNVLAGRPPFLGSNPVSVIRQASETQAPKLRSLAPSLDRDLETICARCLERDPKARYQSADDLATDLERWLEGRPIIARPVSPPARIWRWSQRNPKLLGAATAGVIVGAAAVWLVRSELFPAAQFNRPDRSIATLPLSDSGRKTPDGRIPANEQRGNGAYDHYLQGLLTDLSRPTEMSSVGISVPVRNPVTVPDPEVTAAPPAAEFTSSVRDPTLEARLLKNKITADAIAAPPETAFNSSTHDRDRSLESRLQTNKTTADVITASSETFNSGVRDRSLEPRTQTNKIAADGSDAPPRKGIDNSLRDPALEPSPRATKNASEIAAAPPEKPVTAGVRDRELEPRPRTNKIAADLAAPIQGFVKDAKGEPIKGADVRIESRDGKQLFSTVKTDPKGRYISPGLQKGVYRVTLLVNGAVKASIMNTQVNSTQPTQLNFDFKPKTQATNVARSAKHMVWMPGRTGSHIGGNWVEVDAKENEHSGSNLQTYSVRR